MGPPVAVLPANRRPLQTHRLPSRQRVVCHEIANGSFPRLAPTTPRTFAKLSTCDTPILEDTSIWSSRRFVSSNLLPSWATRAGYRSWRLPAISMVTGCLLFVPRTEHFQVVLYNRTRTTHRLGPISLGAGFLAKDRQDKISVNSDVPTETDIPNLAG